MTSNNTNSPYIGKSLYQLKQSTMLKRRHETTLVVSPVMFKRHLYNEHLNLKIKDRHLLSSVQETCPSYFSEIPLEIFLEIIQYCELRTLLSLSSTCRRFYSWCRNADNKWKNLCYVDFNAPLSTKGKFKTYFEIYQLLYCSRMLMGSFTYSRYFNNIRLKALPHWLMVWASLSENPPVMKYGRHRIARRVRGQYLRKFNDISYGQAKNVFNLSEFADLIQIHPSRQERGTIYFPWRSIRWVAHRKHGNYEEFMLDKCYRSRGFIERNYEKVKGSNPLNIL